MLLVEGFLSSNFIKILILPAALLGAMPEAHARPAPDGESGESSDLEAGILFSDAVNLVGEAPEAGKTSFSASYNKYRQALENLGIVLERYPTSMIASGLLEGRLKVGPWKLDDLRTMVARSARLKAEAENDPLACALLAARKVEDASSRAGLLVEIAGQYIESGKLEQAADVLQEAQESGERIVDDWEVRQDLLVRIVEGYARTGREDLAFAVVDDMLDAEFKAVALARISIWQEKAGRSAEAALTLSLAAQTARSQQSEFTRVRTLTDIVKMLFRTGLNEQAFAVALQVEDDYIRDLILEDLAVDFADEGDHERARQIADSIVHPMSKAVALKALAMDLAKSGRAGKAAETLSRSMAAARTIQDERNRVKLIVDVAGGFRKLGLEGKASSILSQILKLARDTQDGERKVNLLVAVAGSYAQSGDAARAMKLLEEATALAEARVNDDFQDMIFSKIAFQYVRINQYGRAVEVTARIEDGVVLESTKIQMAYELVRNGAYSCASSVIAGIKDPSARDQILAAIAVRMAEAGSFDEGYAAARSMEGGLEKLDALVSIAGIFSRNGEEFNAMEMLRNAFGETLALPESGERARLLARIAAGYLEAGQSDEFRSAIRAMSLFDKAQVLAEISRCDGEKAVGQAGASADFLHDVVQELE
jgi:tetratricopeptide (TPR) repeat protein